MPKAKEIEDAKEALEQELRSLCDSDASEPVLVPSLRELSEKHGLSKSLAQRIVRSLCDQGLLFPVHGMGTFAGRRPQALEKFYLFLYDNSAREALIRSGFEARMSSLGAVTLAIPLKEGLRQLQLGLLPPVEGVWDPSFDHEAQQNLTAPPGVPVVSLMGRVDSQRGIGVAFDEEGGGRRAALHLLSLGARSLIFLGVHAPGAPTGALDWSRRRSVGFLSAVQSVGLEASSSVELPREVTIMDRPEDPYDYFSMGREMGRALPRLKGQEGLVCANDRVAYGVLKGLCDKGISDDEMPPIIGFDSLEVKVGSYLSSMVLPWSDLGRAAADALFRWGSAQERPVEADPIPMGQLTRLSSRPGWLTHAPALSEALRLAAQESDLI